MNQEKMKELLKEAWKEVFQTKTANDDDNFFEIAGDSIKAVQLASWLAQKGVKLDLKNIFTAQTLGKIAETLTETEPMYVPEKLLTKEIAREEFRQIGQQNSPQTAAMQNAANQQQCDPAKGSAIPNAANQQLCDPAKGSSMQNAANQQQCDPTKGTFTQSPVYPQMFPYAQMPMMPGFGYVLVPVMMPVLYPMMMTQMPVMAQDQSFIPQMTASFPGQNMIPGMNFANSAFQRQMLTPEQAQKLDKYVAKPIGKPVEKPNIIKINEPKIAKAEKSAEEVLSYVLNELLPGFDKEKNLFEQGFTSLDVMKLITRCGEYGYKLKMESVFLNPTFKGIKEAMTQND